MTKRPAANSLHHVREPDFIPYQTDGGVTVPEVGYFEIDNREYTGFVFGPGPSGNGLHGPVHVHVYKGDWRNAAKLGGRIEGPQALFTLCHTQEEDGMHYHVVTSEDHAMEWQQHGWQGELNDVADAIAEQFDVWLARWNDVMLASKRGKLVNQLGGPMDMDDAQVLVEVLDEKGRVDRIKEMMGCHKELIRVWDSAGRNELEFTGIVYPAEASNGYDRAHVTVVPGDYTNRQMPLEQLPSCHADFWLAEDVETGEFFVSGQGTGEFEESYGHFSPAVAQAIADKYDVWLARWNESQHEYSGALNALADDELIQSIDPDDRIHASVRKHIARRVENVLDMAA